jgi:uncharacterized protein YndB with AHSA1/START domain
MGSDLDGRLRREAATADRELVVTRILNAPHPLVLKAWTYPGRAARGGGRRASSRKPARWMCGPASFFYRVSMRSLQGTTHTKQGVYREITAPELLVFTYAWENAEGQLGHETLVTVTFTELGTQTKLIRHQALFDSVASRDAHQGGWTSCLERFAQYLAGG